MREALPLQVRRLSTNPLHFEIRVRNPAGVLVVSKLMAAPPAASQPGP